MMGYGPYGHGGSYSSSSSSSLSSNLSPLAPPFMVDRSFTKPNSTPLLDLTEPSLSYSEPLSSSLHNWLPSPKPTPGPKFFRKQKLESGSVPSSNMYRYRGIQKMESSNTHLPPLNAVTSASADVLAFGQCSDTLTANLVEAQPYYPSYLPCTTDNSSPLVVPDQSSYDWLSTSHVPSLDGSSHKDYTQRSSTSKNSAPWGGLWNELGDWELGKQGEFDGSFFSKEADLPVPFYNNYMDQGVHPKDLNTCHVAPLDIDILDLGRHGGLVQPEKLDGQSFLGQNPNFIPAADAKPVFGYGKLETCSGNFNISTETLIDESLMRQNLNFMPAEKVRCNFGVGGFDTFSSNSQLPNNPSYGKHLRQHDVSMNDRTSISKSSTTVVIKPPAAGISSFARHTASIKVPNFGSGATYSDICSNNSSGKSESHNAPQNSEGKANFDPSHLRIQVEKNVPIFSETLLTKNEDLLNNEIVNNSALDNWSKAKCGLGISNVSADDFNLDLKANHMANSVESITEIVDSCNLAVDSPCWKGVPLTSPWQGCESEALIPHQIKKQEVCNSMNVRSKELFLPGTGHAASSLESGENTKHPEFGCLENGLGLHMNISLGASSTFGEQKPADTVKENCHLECGEGFQRSNDIHEIESGFKSYFDCKDSQITQQSLRQEELISDIANEESEYMSQLLSNAMDNFLCSCDEGGSTKVNKSIDQQPTPTIDFLMLLNAMHSMSDVLLFHCTNGLCQLKEKDLRAIKSVVGNLNMSISKNAIMESSSSLEKAKDYTRQQNVLHEPTKTGDRSTQDKHCMPGKEDDKVSKSSFMRGDPGVVEDDKMVQALKKVLSENFHDDEETQPQTLMYKNLWLEAEAALCAVNYKARFNRMKRDVGNGKLHKSEDVPKSPAELSCPYVSTEPDKVQAVSSGAEDFPNSKVQNSSILSTSSEGDDVMARFCILQNRIDNLSAANVDEPSSFKISPDPIEANKEPERSYEANCGPKSAICNQDSNITCTKNDTNDFEASVMSRFQILKSWEDISSSVSKENPMSGNTGFGKRNNLSIIGPRLEDKISSEKVEHVLPHHTFGNVTMKEFHLFDDEDQLVRPPRRNGSGSQLRAGQRESLSSDWEHIMDEECRAQNH